MPSELITDGNLYLKGIIEEIDNIKIKGGKALYRINDKVTDRAVLKVKEYFTKNPEYTIQLKKCARCTHNWDVIITF